MIQNEPIYFTEFKNEFKDFKKELFGQLKYKFNGISEQIADLTVRVTNIESETKGLKESIKRIDSRLDQNSALITIALKKDAKQDIRLDKLEKEIA